jgi:NADPH-dependent curcumin reductase CurA
MRIFPCRQGKNRNFYEVARNINAPPRRVRRAMATPLVKRGELKYREDVVDGLERAPEAFVGLLQGRNFGKLAVSLGDDPRRR